MPHARGPDAGSSEDLPPRAPLSRRAAGTACAAALLAAAGAPPATAALPPPRGGNARGGGADKALRPQDIPRDCRRSAPDRPRGVPGGTR